MEGWIKLFRKMREWAWYKDPITKAVFVEFLFRAKYQDACYKGMELKAGQVIYGRKELADCLGITEQNVRTAISHLKSTKDITTKSTNKLTLVTIENYCLYQFGDDELTNKSTNNLTINQPTTNQQLTTNKNIRKKERKNSLERESKEKDFLKVNHQMFSHIKEAIAQ